MSDGRHRRRSRSPDSRHDSSRKWRHGSHSSDEASSSRHRPHSTSKHHRPSGIPRLSSRSSTDLSAYRDAFSLWLVDRRDKSPGYRFADRDEELDLFGQFCRRWNDGRLSSRYYRVTPARDSTSVVVAGPTLPAGSTVTDRLRDARDFEASEREAERDRRAAERKRDRRERKEEERDERATGKERLLEKKAEKAASAREMARARESGGMVEYDDATLMGGDDSFRAALAARERARNRGRKAQEREERQAQMQDKASEMRVKEDKTMDMFKQLAAARFGAGGGA